MKTRTAIVVSWVFLLHGTLPSGALSIIPHDGYARLEILGANANTVVYQYEISDTSGWTVEAAAPIGEKVLWSLRAEDKATRVASSLAQNFSFVLSSRLLQLDVKSGHTNAVLDFRQLDWPKHDRYPLLSDFDRDAPAEELTREEQAEFELERKWVEEYLWKGVYEYQVPLFTTNQILVFREATQIGPVIETYFRDWVLLRPTEPTRLLASGDGGPLALLSDTFLSGHRWRSAIAACPVDGSATNSHVLTVTQGVGAWEIDSTHVNLDYWPTSRGHLACIHPDRTKFCLVYDEQSGRVTKVEPKTNLDANANWVTASPWLIRHPRCAGRECAVDVFSPDGRLLTSRTIPDTSDHCHFRFRGLTAGSAALFVERTPATTYGKQGGERLRAFLLSMPDGELVALHALNAPSNASDISFGLPHDGLVVVAFGERPVIKKMEVDEMEHSFWIRAFDIYTGKAKWTHQVPVTIKKIWGVAQQDESTAPVKAAPSASSTVR